MNNDDYPSCATRREARPQTTRRCRGSRRRPTRSGSASAAASSGCCTWTSCASAWRREYDLELMANAVGGVEITSPTARSSRSTTRPTCPTGAIAEVASRHPRLDPHAKESSGRSWSSARRRGVHAGMHFLPPSACSHPVRPAAREIVLDFFDQLKTRRRGTPRSTTSPPACGRRTSSSSTCCSAATRSTRSRWSCTATRPTWWARSSRAPAQRIPRQQYDVAIQAAVGAKDHRARDRQGVPQGRHGEVLWRRHLAQAQALEKQKEASAG